MALTVARVAQFMSVTMQLRSFPTFCVYLLMILCAAIWQKSIKPVSLRPVLIVYNFSCCILSAFTALGFIRGIYIAGDVYLKEPTDYLNNVFYLYWVTKNLELLDTVFMIVRHRSRQITFLHIYHHSSMVLLSDFAYHYTSWPAIGVILGLNSIIHVFLYFYYGLTSCDSSCTPQWKQRLTEMQILQFGIDLVFAGYGYIYHGFCIYGFIYGLVMIYLFSNFYYHAYVKKRQRQVKYSKNQ